MDAKAFNMCLEENLFKTSKPKRGKARNLKAIPSNNPYKYQDYVEPIMEAAKVWQNVMVTFAHRNTHEIKPPSLLEHENDVLYQMFAEAVGQDVKFIRI